MCNVWLTQVWMEQVIVQGSYKWLNVSMFSCCCWIQALQPGCSAGIWSASNTAATLIFFACVYNAFHSLWYCGYVQILEVMIIDTSVLWSGNFEVLEKKTQTVAALTNDKLNTLSIWEHVWLSTVVCCMFKIQCWTVSRHDSVNILGPYLKTNFFFF